MHTSPPSIRYTKTRLNVRVAAAIAVTLSLALSLSGAMSAPQACTCVLSQQTSNPDTPPSCYDYTLFTTQNTADGICSNTGCGTPVNCSYSISITVKGYDTGEESCVMAIYIPGYGTQASCSNCTQLTWSPATDPVEVTCDTSTDYSLTYDVLVCNFIPPCGTPMPNVARKTFTCQHC